ncbi:helix-hairpin-helix domain-containing protein [Pedobacter sp. HMF7647]|uniref:Helix-hairpin-helix domain-containing protein n=1 Tax=Hufsiella arboris TaxID=2695275 RepID=A0A7K1YES5_9SPHI|nr:helix-hairpin-helix domain-containing protein [Hufsiella arboris]MXV53092.1 helix-hairpin-helix domain-containing protein [Hufsiella arboris]
MIKRYLKSYFGFTKKELNGLMVLSLLLLFILIVPSIYQAFLPKRIDQSITFQKQVDEFIASAETKRSTYRQVKDKLEDAELEPDYFMFDPNKLSESEWLRLGLRSRQAKVILNYVSKGGHFHKKEDLQKIYSITPEDYQRLAPYIQLPNGDEKFQKFSETKAVYVKKVKAAIYIDLNQADSAELETVDGIGPAFALRIIKYRDRLGGFVSKDQLREVFGIDSAKFRQIVPQTFVGSSQVKKININTATFDDLKQHPYLTYKQMNAIVKYRKQHGNFNGADDLKNIAILNNDVIERIKPYLEF